MRRCRATTLQDHDVETIVGSHELQAQCCGRRLAGGSRWAEQEQGGVGLLCGKLQPSQGSGVDMPVPGEYRVARARRECLPGSPYGAGMIWDVDQQQLRQGHVE